MNNSEYVEAVLRRSEAYTTARVWPANTHNSVRMWISNFPDSEQHIAAAIVDRLTYFSGQAVEVLLRRAYVQLARDVVKSCCNAAARDAALRDFIDKASWTLIQGEDPSPADSGHILCRLLRDLIGIPERRILAPSAALQKLRNGHPLILIDDFLGSGAQASNTLTRTFDSSDSISSIHAAHGTSVSVLALVATEVARRRIAHSAPGVRVYAAHVLDDDCHVLRQPATGMSRCTSEMIAQFIDKYHRRLQVPDFIGNNAEYRKYGFANLGLTLVFEHCIPDSSLPILWARAGQNWQPLKERA